jgi:PAT family beta-lactamase induction signal transducer AmpG
VRLSLRRVLAVVAFYYFVEGFPPGVFHKVAPVYFRESGLSLELVGAFSGLALAWSLKFLWSPLVDRFGEQRAWVSGALAVMGGSLLLLSAADLSAPAAAIWLALSLYCVASATQDIAIDAYTIGLVPRGQEGPANGVRIAAYRTAMLAGGGGLLLLPRWIGWPATFEVAAALHLALAASVWLAPATAVRTAERQDLVPALRAWLGRPGAAGVLVFVLLYRLGDMAMGPMLTPFWIDRGLTREELALVSTTLGAVAVVAGGGVGGLYVSRRGIGRALIVLGVFALLSNLVYAAAAAWPATGRAGIYTASLVESFCSGLVAAGFLAFLMRICEREHAAVQYAGLSALSLLLGSAAGAVSGWLTHEIGYAGYFALTALLALPALTLVGAARAWLPEDQAAARCAA